MINEITRVFYTNFINFNSKIKIKISFVIFFYFFFIYFCLLISFFITNLFFFN